MRLFAFALLTLFSFQVLDIPPLRNVPNPRTCCGRPVCLCTHAKGAFCPIKYKREQSQKTLARAAEEKPTAHKHCHLKRETPGGAAKEEPSRVNLPVRETFPVFKKAPCHSEKSPVSHPSSAKEFVLGLSGTSGVLQGTERWFPLKFHEYDSSFAGGIDHPPKLALSL